MKAPLLFLGFLMALSLEGRGQAVTKPLPVLPATFYTVDFQPSTAQDSAAYCVQTTFRDSVSGVMRVYYPSGRLRQYVPYSDVYGGIRFGTMTSWYEDGQMNSK